MVDFYGAKYSGSTDLSGFGAGTSISLDQRAFAKDRFDPLL
jgi:hypothetical protein